MAPESRSPWRSTTTSPWATSGGCSPRSTTAPTCRCSRRWSVTPASASRSTTPARSSSGWRRSAPSSSCAWGRWSRATRWSSWAAACTSRSSPPFPSRTVSTSCAHGVHDPGPHRPQTPGRLARRAGLGAGPADVAGPGRVPLDHPGRPALPQAAIPEANLWGAYTTEDQGNLLTVFGTEQGLRYRIPFGTVEDVIGYLREHATEDGKRVGMMGDDGEKFGAWPTTYEHCWGERRWVARFFEALEANGDWLTTVTPSHGDNYQYLSKSIKLIEKDRK